MVELSLAPMLKVTTPQFRLFTRKMAPSAVLFTEMIVANTVIYASDEKLQHILGQPEPRTVVQIGGSEPDDVARAVEKLVALGWHDFNLNCGCPSDRVQSGCFGAILMRDAGRVVDIINAVHGRTGAVLSLKIRIGVDELDSYDFFRGFVERISRETPCRKFYVHARKCWLKGLNPKQNRTVPPLNYQFVYDLKAAMPHLFIALNGGIARNGLDVLGNLDGLMIGRHAVDDPFIFSYYDALLAAEHAADHEYAELASLQLLGAAVRGYLSEAADFFCSKSKVLLPLNNVRRGKGNNKAFRKLLSEMAHNELGFDQIMAQLEPHLC
ncbi:tRNA-dihydrouridine synthase A [Pancytospora philotis]|nr:tRNA-dihydrouridine synthase A [Pancytospora philotis]